MQIKVYAYHYLKIISIVDKAAISKWLKFSSYESITSQG